MRIYVAAQFETAGDVRNLAKKITEARHQVVSTWHQVSDKNETRQDAWTDRAISFCCRDIIDLNRADTILFISQGDGSKSKGGRHFELGYAAAQGKRLLMIGPAENVFHAIPHIRHFDDEESFLTWLRQ